MPKVTQPIRFGFPSMQLYFKAHTGTHNNTPGAHKLAAYEALPSFSCLMGPYSAFSSHPAVSFLPGALFSCDFKFVCVIL